MTSYTFRKSNTSKGTSAKSCLPGGSVTNSDPNASQDAKRNKRQCSQRNKSLKRATINKFDSYRLFAPA
ncbi:hypothetical protein TNCV_4695881 [Trichonephila clavipes]|nr:hypothetical protein TNCV_4695881 [Trichonephila clavipes]